MAETTPRSIRLDEGLLKALRNLARAQHRSLNNLIEVVLREYVEEYEVLADEEFQQALREAEGDDGIPWREVVQGV